MLPSSFVILTRGTTNRQCRFPSTSEQSRRTMRMAKTMQDISEAMRDIDVCTLSTHTGGGSIGARPMSNNRNVEFDGDAWFFTYENRQMVNDIGGDPNVGVTYLG